MWSFQLYVHEIHPHGEPHWKKYGSFPGYPVVKTCAPMQGAGVQSLVKKLQSHTPHGIAKKKKCVNHWNSPGSPVVKTLSFHYRAYRFNPSTAKKKKEKPKTKKKVWLSGLGPILCISTLFTTHICVSLHRRLLQTVYITVAVSVLKYSPPKKGRGKVYSHHGRSSAPGKTLARLWHLTSCVSPSAKWG